MVDMTPRVSEGMNWHACVAVSDTIGLGHIVRVQALLKAAEVALQHIWVWTDWSSKDLYPLIRSFPFSAVPINFDGWPGDICPDAIVVDMPDPPRSLLDQTRNIKRKLLLGCSDNRQQWADLTVNVAEGAALDQPEPLSHGRLWQGARFAALRPEFLHGRHSEHDLFGPILIIIGGTDAAGLSLSVVRVLLDARSYTTQTIELVLAANHPDWAAIDSLCQIEPRLSVIDRDCRLAERMQRASAAIIAPGNLLFECLALHTPAIAITQNERQAKDFQSYPWLLQPECIDLLPSMLHRLLREELPDWVAYATRSQTGQSLSRLISWCNVPNSVSRLC